MTRVGVNPSTIQIPPRALRSSRISCQRLFRSSLVLLLAILLGHHFVACSFAKPVREPIREPLREPVHRRLAGNGLSDLHEKLGALWDMASRVSLNGTVIIASSNAGYEDMLENWVLHLERVGLGRHFIVFAADSKSLEFARSKWPGQAIHLDLSGQFGQEERADVEGASRIGSAAFHRVASHRAIYIHHLLSFGFSVLYSDIDIAFLHNPLPFFQKAGPNNIESGGGGGGGIGGSAFDASSAAADATASNSDFDMFITHDQYMSQPSPYTDPIDPNLLNGLPLFCSCFLFFRPTLPAKSLVGNWAFRMAKLGRQGGLDQDQLNLVMQWMLERKVLPRIGVLPPLQFPSGQLMRDHWGKFEEVRPRVVMVHANYLTGKEAKIEGLKKAGQEALFRNWFTHVGRIPAQPSLPSLCLISLYHPPTPPSSGQEALFRNWFTHMGGIPSLGNIVLASVPPQMSTPGGHVITRSSESLSPRVARATCLLLPSLILARLLAANVTVLYSDINSVWLRDPRRYFPPTYSLVLPSLSHLDPPPQPQQPQQQQQQQQQQQAAPAPPNTTALTPSLLGSLSPWLMALCPSPAVQAMVHRWAVGALRGYLTAGAAATRGGSGVFSGSEILRTSLNHAVAEMVRGAKLVGVEEDGFGGGSEGGVGSGMEAGTAAGMAAGAAASTGDTGEERSGASVGVLPEQLFPPGWKAVGDRAWLEAHRREIVAVQVSCGEEGRQQEVCLRDMKLWL
ncbi:unnamed protein product [Closterium sp. Yama58-4]|nr:unnamed protein product [Closterium sp. Yama58-4]